MDWLCRILFLGTNDRGEWPRLQLGIETAKWHFLFVIMVQLLPFARDISPLASIGLGPDPYTIIAVATLAQHWLLPLFLPLVAMIRLHQYKGLVVTPITIVVFAWGLPHYPGLAMLLIELLLLAVFIYGWRCLWLYHYRPHSAEVVDDIFG